MGFLPSRFMVRRKKPFNSMACQLSIATSPHGPPALSWPGIMRSSPTKHTMHPVEALRSYFLQGPRDVPPATHRRPLMKMRMVKIALACLLIPAAASAQDARLKLPEFKSLAGKATESVNISLSPLLLHLAGAFIDEKDADSVTTKQLLAGIKAIEIRSYHFATDFAYSAADIDGVRSQLSGPGWNQLLQVHHRDKSEDVDM